MDLPELTPIQKAKAKYYIKNKDKIIQNIAENHRNRYKNDDEFRAKILSNMKEYYNKNKAKRHEYYLKRKQEQQQQTISVA